MLPDFQRNYARFKLILKETEIRPVNTGYTASTSFPSLFQSEEQPVLQQNVRICKL